MSQTIEPVVLPSNDMTMGGMVKYAPTQLTVLTPLSWEQLTTLAAMMQGEHIFSERFLPWYEGDLLNWAEAAFGEAYPQIILDELGDGIKNTLRNRKYVCNSVHAGLRREEEWVTFSHHAEVASLKTDEEKRYWLEFCASHRPPNNLSVTAFRKAIRDSRVIQDEPVEAPALSPEPEEPRVLQMPLMLQIVGLADLPEGSALRRIKAEALPALAEFMPENTKKGNVSALALFNAVDEMMDAWYAELAQQED